MNKQIQSSGVLYLITIALFSLYLYSCKSSSASAPEAAAVVPVLVVDTATATTWQDYAATIEGKTDVAIRPQVSGYLQSVAVDEGSYVHAGQLLFKIDDRPYREALNNAVANLHAAQAAITAADIEVEKLDPLVKEKVIADIQSKSAKASYKMAVARAEQAKAAVDAAKINMAYTSVTAPVSGYIGRLPYKKGSLVSSADPSPLTTISDVSEVHAYFSMSEAEFLQFSKQHHVRGADKGDLPAAELVLADGEPYTNAGKVDMVDGQFDQTTGAITLRAAFTNDQGILRSGNTGKVRIHHQHNASLLVPQQATVELQDKAFVYVVDAGNKVSKKPIIIAGKSGTDYIVKAGLAKGDRIVSEGVEKLQEGQQIKPAVAERVTASK